MTTIIVLNAVLGLALVSSLLLFLGHAVHADRFMHRRHLRLAIEAAEERLAA
jgi:hypothetical protein